MVVPTLATLLAHAARQRVGDACPSARAQLGDELEHFCVLLFGPGSLDNLVA